MLSAGSRAWNWIVSKLRAIGVPKRAAPRLQETEYCYRTLVEGLPEFFWTSLPDGRCDFVSPSWLAYAGGVVRVEEPELLGHGWLSFLHPGDQERIRACWRSAVQSAADFDEEFRLRDGAGRHRWFRAVAQPVRDPDGRIVKWVGTCRDLHDIKLAQGLLHSNGQNFRQLADAIPDIVFTCGPEGEVDYYNRHWEPYAAMLFDEPEDCPGQRVIHPDDIHHCEEKWRQAVAAGEPYEVECRLRNSPGGPYRWHLGRCMALRDEGGEIVRWIGTYIDIDAQKTGEAKIASLNQALEQRVQERTAALSASEERYRLLVDGIRDYAILMLDAEGRVASWTRSAERLKGYSAEEILGKPFTCFYTAADRERGYPQEVLRQASECGHFEDEGWRVRKDGSLFWASVMVTALRGESGRLTGFSKITHDLTLRKESQEKLRKTEALFRAILELAPDAVLIADEQGKIVLVSAQAEQLFGYPRQELIGQPVELLMPVAKRGGHERNRKKYASDPQLRQMGAGLELAGLRKDGVEFPVEISLSAIKTEGGSWVAAAVRDITERKKVEQQFIRARQHAEEANRAKSGFVAAVSHEIRTPMNSILGMADLLSESDLNPEQKQYVEIFRRAGSNLLILIDDILDLSKLEAGHFELERVAFDLEDVVDEALELAGAKAQPKGLLLRRVSPPLPNRLIGDPTRLRQVLINLLGNAVKFTEGGEIVLTIRPSARPGEFEFAVSDTGIGIDEEKLRMIFDDFTQADSTTSRKYGGTGLGLGISKRLVERMGGSLSVTSAPGEGSVFRFSVMLEPAPNRESDARQPRMGMRESGRAREAQKPLRILLADDSPDNRLLIQCYLKGSPHRLIFAEDGRQAVSAFQAGGFDLILMDIQMPGMDGLDATRAIREIERTEGSARIPIVALTANARAEDVELSGQAGCDAHLSKPISKARLLTSLDGFSAMVPDFDPEPPPGLENLIPGYLASRLEDLKELRSRAAAGDFARVRYLAHNIKGTGTAYGFRGLTEVAEKMVRSAEAADAAAVTLQIAHLADYLAGLPSAWFAGANPADAGNTERQLA
jgi:PAS domain S-box-containing protein